MNNGVTIKQLLDAGITITEEVPATIYSSIYDIENLDVKDLYNRNYDTYEEEDYQCDKDNVKIVLSSENIGMGFSYELYDLLELLENARSVEDVIEDIKIKSIY